MNTELPSSFTTPNIKDIPIRNSKDKSGLSAAIVGVYIKELQEINNKQEDKTWSQNH